MLKIENLHASIGANEIISGLNLEVPAGSVHAIMGLNGSGKSTLSKAIAGHSDISVTSGDIKLDNQSVLELEIEERAAAGIFVGFQYPVEIPGLNNMHFLRTAVNNIKKAKNEEEISASDFLKAVRKIMQEIGMNEELIKRPLNTGFSGGEKKKNEILQLRMMNPKLAILDEIDSGLDIDALKSVAGGINQHRNKDNAVLLITHYQRLLELVQPDYVHIVDAGKIIKSGPASLALELEEQGYEAILK